MNIGAYLVDRDGDYWFLSDLREGYFLVPRLRFDEPITSGDIAATYDEYHADFGMHSHRLLDEIRAEWGPVYEWFVEFLIAEEP